MNTAPKTPQEIISTCQDHWQNPCSTFASGKDEDTCENAMLVKLYGALSSAADTSGLDADKEIIDVSTLEKLQHVQFMTDMNDFNAEDIAHKLNDFIRSDVHFIWHELPTFNDFENYELTLEFIQKVSVTLFTAENEIAASRLLFYLFPMLPIFDYVPNVPFAADVDINSYEEFHRLAAKHYRHIKPALNKIATKPVAHYGSTEEQTLVNDLLSQTDWWQRRIFNETLRDMARQNET